MPGRLPGTRQALGAVLRGRRLVVAAGGYPAARPSGRPGATLPIDVVPPGVDIERFRPARRRRAPAPPAGASGCRPTAELVVGVSRLVPRKGFDVLIDGASPTGRAPPRPRGRHRRRRTRPRVASHAADRARRRRCASSVAVATTTCRALYACGDVFTMLCRNRWGGLEQEGFGIVFLEAAACGVAQVAGRSGGAARGRRRRRDRARRRRPGELGAVADALADCSTTRRAGRRWERPRGNGPSPSSPTTCSPRASAQALGVAA